MENKSEVGYSLFFYINHRASSPVLSYTDEQPVYPQAFRAGNGWYRAYIKVKDVSSESFTMMEAIDAENEVLPVSVMFPDSSEDGFVTEDGKLFLFHKSFSCWTRRKTARCFSNEELLTQKRGRVFQPEYCFMYLTKIQKTSVKKEKNGSKAASKSSNKKGNKKPDLVRAHLNPPDVCSSGDKLRPSREGIIREMELRAIPQYFKDELAEREAVIRDEKVLKVVEAFLKRALNQDDRERGIVYSTENQVGGGPGYGALLEENDKAAMKRWT